MKPVRKIGPSQGSITGMRPSQKTQVAQHFESSLERDFLTLLEYDDTVENYGVQPVTIHYYHNNKRARYTPDAIVYYKAAFDKRPQLCEIKYEADLQKEWAYYEPKFIAATEYALNNGLQFRVFTEKEIRSDYLHNVKFLSRYHNTTIDEAYLQVVAAGLSQKEITTPQELLIASNKEENAKILYTVWQMVATKLIGCDMQNRLTMSSPIWNKQL